MQRFMVEYCHRTHVSKDRNEYLSVNVRGYILSNLNITLFTRFKVYSTNNVSSSSCASLLLLIILINIIIKLFGQTRPVSP